jgi:hypothetical protein
MPTVSELLKLAHDCYAQARAATNPYTRLALVHMGDNYLKEVGECRREPSLIDAATLRLNKLQPDGEPPCARSLCRIA